MTDSDKPMEFTVKVELSEKLILAKLETPEGQEVLRKLLSKPGGSKTSGSFVIPAAAVEYYGRHVVEALSRMVLPKDIFDRFKKVGRELTDRDKKDS